MVSAIQSLAPEAEYHFTQKDFDFIRRRLYQIAGISLADHKTQLVYSRIARRVRRLKLDSFASYCELIKHDNSPELDNFINALTTNKTSFYREPHHFDYLVNQLLPRWGSSKKKIWSSACSTGQEPYSIAIALHCAPQRTDQIEILATDLDTDVLAKAKAGVYERMELDEIPKTHIKPCFYKGLAAQEGKVKVKPEIMKSISFRQFNLVTSWPKMDKVDAIFCRNVMIYFDTETQQSIIEKFHRQLNSDGILFLGHSESIGACKERFKQVGRTIFQKI